METGVALVYLVAIVCFIFGLKRMAHVRTSRQGNIIAGIGMFLAMIATIGEINAAHPGAIDYRWILAGLVVGTIIGAVAALRVKMTAMPEMVALFNGMGGIASALVAISYFFLHDVSIVPGHVMVGSGGPAGPFPVDGTVTIMLSVIVGGVTFTGSVVAWAKLAGKIPGAPILLPGRHVVNIVLLGASAAIGAVAAFVVTGTTLMGVLLIVLLLVVFVLGVTLVIPIGGADMPVVISLLNSYSGVAASMTGFVLHNNVLIIAGALVGAAGLILTQLMCKAMNRSLANVLFGGFGVVAQGSGREGYTNVKEAGPEEAAMLLEDAQSVIFVPGYGLAVAQAQHACYELGKLLESRGATVRYAIHPVAGRMPGHMNVLLAEADVPYDQLVEMDDINPEFKNTDVVIVLGANDVVNPAAIKDDKSPIWGMPILNVYEARTVFVVKRSLSPGFAGIRNELFENENTLMLFGDAKEMLLKLIEELKNA